MIIGKNGKIKTTIMEERLQVAILFLGGNLCVPVNHSSARVTLWHLV